MSDFLSADLRRRKFLIFGGCALPFVRSLNAQSVRLHPHYRTQTPLDAVLLKTKAGLDDFVTEKYHDQIAAILAEWSTDLIASARRTQAVEKVLSPGFLGSSPVPAESRLIRSGPMLEVHRVTYAALLEAGAFLQAWRSALSSFSKIMTAEFQVTRIDANSGGLQTRVRYEFVGAGHDFYREQRVGFWELEWESASQGEYRLRRWQAEDEIRSRSTGPCYADITARVLGGNSSYSQQM